MHPIPIIRIPRSRAKLRNDSHLIETYRVQQEVHESRETVSLPFVSVHPFAGMIETFPTDKRLKSE